MRPRKPSKLDAVVQVNLRIDERLRRQLEAAAKERHITFSQEVRLRLTEAEPSLADALTNFKRRARDVIEHSVHISSPKEIENAWGRLQKVDAACAGFYTAVENELSLYVRDPAVRQLLRGAPALLPSEQERGAGGKK
jgi:hypothetical protein